MAHYVSAMELREMERDAETSDDEKGRHCWCALAPSHFMVGGENYLVDKVKFPSTEGTQACSAALRFQTTCPPTTTASALM